MEKFDRITEQVKAACVGRCQVEHMAIRSRQGSKHATMMLIFRGHESRLAHEQCATLLQYMPHNVARVESREYAARVISRLETQLKQIGTVAFTKTFAKKLNVCIDVDSDRVTVYELVGRDHHHASTTPKASAKATEVFARIDAWVGMEAGQYKERCAISRCYGNHNLALALSHALV